eukprot:TRINITY_DN26907_c0_g1_i2.p1 TRINITY_DN26907_c0_g1~~TRINITY_DN26907_c0_g1_i2.p1  ORF type:complete len:366 (+),score=107.18 TRINITY_DN26907_c0_g1_i2:89-1186(+)
MAQQQHRRHSGRMGANDNDDEPATTANRGRDNAAYSETMKIFFVVAFYFVISIALVFLNKNIMVKDFEFPLFITWWQLVVALVSVWILGIVGRSVPAVSMIPPMEFNLEIAKKIAPLAGCFVGMVSFNNLCLLYVEVTFYQVARSLTICFSLVFTYTILHQTTSWPAVRACLVVMIGFIIGSVGEVHFSWLGVIFGVTSSAFVALYGIYVKKVMPFVDGDQWRLLIYNTVLSIFFMIPVIIMGGEVNGLLASDLFYQTSTWINMTITGIFGFVLNIAVFLQIKFTSPLTNNISGTLKACMQTLLAMLFYRNPISALNAIGIFLVIFGSFWYSNIRYMEMKANAPLPTVAPPPSNPQPTDSEEDRE